MQLHIADTNELTALDLKVLSALLGDTAPAPAAKATPAPAKPAAPKPEPVVETPEAAPAQPVTDATDEAEEDLMGGDEVVTRADAVAAATQLVSTGKQAKVKEALAAVGAKRVSEVADDKLAEFVAALS